MSKKVLLIAGALLAVGSVAAISAPHFRGGGHMRHGPQGSIFGEHGGDLFGPRPRASASAEGGEYQQDASSRR